MNYIYFEAMWGGKDESDRISTYNGLTNFILPTFPSSSAVGS